MYKIGISPLFSNSGRQADIVVPPYLLFHFPWGQLPMVNHGPEADDLPSDCNKKVNSSLTLGHSTYIIHLVSSPHVGMFSSHIKKEGEYRAMSSFEKDHIHATVITAYCYNCSILLLVIINL